MLIFAEMALIVVFVFKTSLRRLVIIGLDRIKRGKGPIVIKTVGSTVFVVMASSVYNAVKIRNRWIVNSDINLTDHVLFAKHVLEASLMGFGISATRLGLPDTGLISYGEMVDQGRQITQAVSIPVIGDGDNGYGNAMNVKRTVKGYISAGFAGIILEDQVAPKACGHTQGRKVVSVEEAVMRIKAAVDARKESGSDIIIVARTDSRQAVSLNEALWRSRAFADAGADVLFIDALASKEEMKAFCEVSPLVPKMANMLEGGGKTPILNPIELADIGYKLVVYPLSLMGVSLRAMQDALIAIKGGRIPPPGSMPTFEEMKEILGFNAYYEEEKRYETSTSQLSSQRAELLPIGSDR